MLTGKIAIDVEEIRAYTIFQGDPDFGDNHPQVIINEVETLYFL